MESKIESKKLVLELEGLNKKISNILWKSQPSSFVVREPTQNETEYDYMKSLYDTNIRNTVFPVRQLWNMSHFAGYISHKCFGVK